MNKVWFSIKDLNDEHLIMLLYVLILTWCDFIVNQPDSRLHARIISRRIFITVVRRLVPGKCPKVWKKGGRGIFCKAIKWVDDAEIPAGTIFFKGHHHPCVENKKTPFPVLR
jgi:hypothetical protein